MASPSLQPTRPAGWVDLRRPADYPIILGDSLKSESGKATSSFVNIRYNWQPKSGLGSRKSKLTKAGDKYDIRVRPTDSDDEGGDFQYQGTTNSQAAGGNSKNATKSLALIFDKSKSAFVLESISTSLDMNLKSSTGFSSKSARELPQLPTNNGDSPRSSNDHTQPPGKSKLSPPIEDEPGDSSNPFDYRHFIAEARDSLEKSTQQQQQRQAGDRTPLSGISTPVPPGASRFVSTTPQFRATASSSKISSAAQQRKKKEDATSSRGGLGHSRTTSSTTAKAAAAAASVKRNPTSKASLSKETISDSDSDADSETIAVSRLPAPKASRPAAVSNAQRPKPPIAKGHTRNVSANIGSSPHIIINDDDGDLEIDMGSPEPEERNRRNHRVDPEMFRSHTNTPLGGHSSNFGNTNRPSQQRPGDGSHLKDGTVGNTSSNSNSNNSARRDRDISMKDIEAEASPSDEDGDVEEFELGSPQEKRPSSSTLLNSSRIEHDRDEDEDDDNDNAPAPTPPAPRTDRMQVDDDDEDDEDLLAAALEAALDEEDEVASASAGIGLGIGMSHHQQLSDESEVSEEE
ncbi:hypothetical protein LTR84_000643 [Exophiala bonariae]|uniref:Transcription elongation factor Eaf N-terminal domain-containing protein n=1 Tax=Exophiala bonariae TaxID=1690606 RepID=A0AAV9NR69_9EURO|nr:hypothetical protein LTR84_000643 [Exophiala bonariae]